MSSECGNQTGGIIHRVEQIAHSQTIAAQWFHHRNPLEMSFAHVKHQ
jgi:hypothetical protein